MQVIVLIVRLFPYMSNVFRLLSNEMNLKLILKMKWSLFSYLPPSFLWIFKPFCFEYEKDIALTVIYFKMLWHRQLDFIFIYMYIYVDIHTCMYLYTHLHIYTCVYKYIHIYAHTSISSIIYLLSLGCVCTRTHKCTVMLVYVMRMYLCVNLFWPISRWTVCYPKKKNAHPG